LTTIHQRKCHKVEGQEQLGRPVGAGQTKTIGQKHIQPGDAGYPLQLDHKVGSVLGGEDFFWLGGLLSSNACEPLTT